MNLPFGLQIISKARSIDTSKSGWRQRFGDAVQVARGKAGIKDIVTDRATAAQLSEFYSFLPKLTMIQIKGLLYSWMGGNFQAGYDLISIMLDTWPMALKNQHECRSTLRRVQFKAIPYKPSQDQDASADAQAKAQFINHMMEQFRPTAGTDERGWGGTIYGLGGALLIPTIREVLYRTEGSDILPYATVWATPRSYGFTDETTDDGRQITRLGARVSVGQKFNSLSTQYNYSLNPYGVNEQYITPARSLVAIYDTRDGGITMTGLVRSLAWWWGGMMYGRDWLLRYAELFGQPFRHATYDPNISAADKAELKDLLANMGATAYFAGPTGTTLEIIEAKGLGNDNPQRYMIEKGDFYCNLLFHGETLTSSTPESGGGTRAQGQVHQNTRTGRDVEYADWMAETLREQLVRQVTLINFGNDTNLPIIKPEFPKEIDKTEQAAVVTQWLANYDMDAEDAAQISNLPLKPKNIPAPVTLATVTAEDIETAKEDDQLRATRRAICRPAQVLRASTPAQSVSDSLATALAADFKPIADRLREILFIQDETDFKAALAKLQQDLPSLLPEDPESAQAIADTMSMHFFNALDDARTAARPGRRDRAEQALHPVHRLASVIKGEIK